LVDFLIRSESDEVELKEIYKDAAVQYSSITSGCRGVTIGGWVRRTYILILI